MLAKSKISVTQPQTGEIVVWYDTNLTQFLENSSV